MLGFLRKHQRYFFVIITIVIVISFSFFGTYTTLNQTSAQDPIAFTAIDGTQVTRSELNQMVMFIGTDGEDKRLFGGIWGPNFLNDGVLKKDFFEAGLSELLVDAYSQEVEPDLRVREEKEKRFTLYAHPQAQFLSVTSAWKYVAPELKKSYEALTSGESKNVGESFRGRVDLYLAEKKFPAPLLRQVLLYQQNQYNWLTPDPNLERKDLSLFGYHTVEDWFGSRFLRLAAEFIINASLIAEKQGYQVSKTEALADLMRNAESNYQQLSSSPYLGVKNSQEYFSEQLQRMRLDQNSAADIWRRVMLFRRFFHDVGNMVFVDPLMFQKYDAYAMETVEGLLYHLPKEFQFSRFEDLQKYEVYLEAITPSTDKLQVLPPSQFLSVSQISKQNPELVQKRYLLDIAKVDKEKLQAKVSVRETWNWEVEDQNWSKLQKQFADVGTKKGETREDRFAVLDHLDDKTRSKIDAFARQAIADSHPEWLDEVLQATEFKRINVGLRLKGKNSTFTGLKNNQNLMQLLDKVALNEQDPLLLKYTPDDKVYYRIIVIDRTPEEEILTFKEADQEGVLEGLLQKKLESYYTQIRETQLPQFKKEDGSWKPLSEVKEDVAPLYFDKALKAIQEKYTTAVGLEKAPKTMIPDVIASLRFYPYVNQLLQQAKENPASLEQHVVMAQNPQEEGKLPLYPPLGEQWKLEKSDYQAERGQTNVKINLNEAFHLSPNSWGTIQTPVNGDLHVFYLMKKSNQASEDSLVERITSAKQLLAGEAQQVLMHHVLQEIKEKKAISLDFLNHNVDEKEE